MIMEVSPRFLDILVVLMSFAIHTAGHGGGGVRIQLGRPRRGGGEEVLHVPLDLRDIRGGAAYVQGAVREGQGT
jgi:hypothetical protein